MSTESSLTNKRSALCIYNFDSMLSLAQDLISFWFVIIVYYSLKLLRFSPYMQRRINIPYRTCQAVYALTSHQ